MWQHIQYGNGKNKNIITRDSHIQHMISNLMGRTKIVDEFCLLSRIVTQCFMVIRIFTLIVMERKKWELHSKTPTFINKCIEALSHDSRCHYVKRTDPSKLIIRTSACNKFSFWSQHETIFRQNSASVSIAFNISKKMIELLLSSEKKNRKQKKKNIQRFSNNWTCALVNECTCAFRIGGATSHDLSHCIFECSSANRIRNSYCRFCGYLYAAQPQLHGISPRTVWCACLYDMQHTTFEWIFVRISVDFSFCSVYFIQYARRLLFPLTERERQNEEVYACILPLEKIRHQRAKNNTKT